MRSSNWMNYENVVMFINNGMDLTWRDPLKNGTILHYWAGTPFNHHNSNQEDSLAVVKLLIENGVVLLSVNSLGYTPILEAATGRDGECPNLMVFDFLLKRDEYSRVEKIEAMELAGALILGHVYNGLNHLFHKAFDYWRKALQLRQMDVEGSDHIQKTSLNLKTVCTTEWTTSEELEDVIGHPETYMIQSFLVRLRIFFCSEVGKELKKTVLSTEWINSAELEDVIEHPETYMIQSCFVRLRIFFYRDWTAIESLFKIFATKVWIYTRLELRVFKGEFPAFFLLLYSHHDFLPYSSSISLTFLAD